MATAAEKIGRARRMRAKVLAFIDAAKYPKGAPSTFGVGDIVKFAPVCTDAILRMFEVQVAAPTKADPDAVKSESLPMTWRVHRLTAAGTDLPTGAIHVKVEPVQDSTGRWHDPRPFGAGAVHVPAIAQELQLVRSAKATPDGAK